MRLLKWKRYSKIYGKQKGENAKGYDEGAAPVPPRGERQGGLEQVLTCKLFKKNLGIIQLRKICANRWQGLKDLFLLHALRADIAGSIVSDPWFGC